MNSIRSKNILITGATSGIGKVVACTLAQQGAIVIATARNADRGTELIHYFETFYPNSQGKIEFVICDLSSFESIMDCIAEFKTKYSRLDILINNAGVFNSKFKQSKNHIEETFHINVLAPLLIIDQLASMIIESKGRIINTSSSFHHGKINFNDIEGRKIYSGFNAYRQSKLCGLILMKTIARKLNGTGAQIFSQHPGVVNTNLGRNSNFLFKAGLKLIGNSPEKGAETLLYLATAPTEKLKSGQFYAHKKVWRTKPESNNLKLAHDLIRVCRYFLGYYSNKSSFLFVDEVFGSSASID